MRRWAQKWACLKNVYCSMRILTNYISTKLKYFYFIHMEIVNVYKRMTLHKAKSYFIHWNSSLSIEYDETNKHDKWYFWNTMHYCHFRSEKKNCKIGIHKRIQRRMFSYFCITKKVCMFKELYKFLKTTNSTMTSNNFNIKGKNKQ